MAAFLRRRGRRNQAGRSRSDRSFIPGREIEHLADAEASTKRVSSGPQGGSPQGSRSQGPRRPRPFEGVAGGPLLLPAQLPRRGRETRRRKAKAAAAVPQAPKGAAPGRQSRRNRREEEVSGKVVSRQ